MAEKARYFLEKSIPELKEWEKKKIFTKEEISAITQKRTEFEYRVNTPGCKPADYVRYAEYEMAVEKLRKKRVKRFSAKLSKNFMGQRRIFFVLERATRKFHGDLGLWRLYMDYAEKEGAWQVLEKTMNTCLKLHPTKAELWIFAAKRSTEIGSDMMAARAYMQRGLRFNNRSKALWLEYTKLELIYITKILIRRRILGIDKVVTEGENGDEEQAKPKVAEEDEEEFKGDKTMDVLAMENVHTNPALNGAIPLAVFDQAITEFPGDEDMALDFFDLFASFPDLHCYKNLLNHVFEHIEKTYPDSPQTYAIRIEMPLYGIDVTDASVIPAVSGFLSGIKNKPSELTNVQLFYMHIGRFICKFLDINKNLDDALKTVLVQQVLRICHEAESTGTLTAPIYIMWHQAELNSGRVDEAIRLLEKGKEQFPHDKKLAAIRVPDKTKLLEAQKKEEQKSGDLMILD
ncbi:hypothetical protein BJ508DRAFT_245082 [Ascobolus immersus RN42]|uniref:U3 small nucleolar RNA-associated protein 6 N-terminal domain-containing protein n=1 Tax=Ascobolus immersus RN42 TaxID=1160509 RepID=A0A3N4HEN3_ASCIM|nr:hypothetical protein BJ508DRAFT_245082 [Ascobolus immersus RN42]